MKDKSKIIWVHAAVMLFFMFVFGRIFPPISGITSLGMKFIGIFIGVLYGWTTCGILWPSLLAWVGIASTGMLPVADYIKVSFGNDTVVFIVFVCIFTAVITEAGLVDFISNWILSRKFVAGNPWNYTAALLIGCFIAAQINMLPAILVFWGIVLATAERFGLKKGDPWVTYMMMGVGIAASFGGIMLPYHMVPLVVLGVASAVTGISMNFFQYLCLAVPATILSLILYILIGKFIVRPDMTKLNHLQMEYDPEKLKLNKKQKVAAIYLFVFMAFMLIPGALPEGNALKVFLSGIGNLGITFLLLISMFWVHVDGKPFIGNFSVIAGKGVNWDIYIIFVFVIPFATLFTHEATGVKAALITALQPILSGHSPMIFIFMVMIIAGILTNFANNMVVGSSLVPIIYAIGGAMGINIMATVAALVIAISFSFATPAASTAAAMVFAHDWVDRKEAYKSGVAFSIIGLIIMIPISVLLANVVF